MTTPTKQVSTPLLQPAYQQSISKGTAFDRSQEAPAAGMGGCSSYTYFPGSKGKTAVSPKLRFTGENAHITKRHLIDSCDCDGTHYSRSDFHSSPTIDGQLGGVIPDLRAAVRVPAGPLSRRRWADVTTSQDLRPTVAIADPDVGEREMAGVRDVLASGQLSAGETVQSFEAEFASYCGVDHGVATSNGTTALHTALEALDLGEGTQSSPRRCRSLRRRTRFASPGLNQPSPTSTRRRTTSTRARSRRRSGRSTATSTPSLAVHLYAPAPMDRLRRSPTATTSR